MPNEPEREVIIQEPGHTRTWTIPQQPDPGPRPAPVPMTPAQVPDSTPPASTPDE
jgi:hypothetical protein